MAELGSYTTRSERALEEREMSENSDANPYLVLFAALTQLARRKKLIVTATFTSISIGVLYCLALPARYTATIKIMTHQQTHSSASLLMSQLTNTGPGTLAMAAGAGLGLRNPNDTYVGLLNSRPIADAIVKEFELTNAYGIKTSTGARKALIGNTKIASEKSGFIVVSVTDRDRDRAAAIANAYPEQLRILTKTLAVTEAAQRRLFYAEQLKHASDTLSLAELSFRNLQENKGLIQLEAQAKTVIGGLADLHAQIVAKQVQLQALPSYSTERNSEVALAENQLASLQAEASKMELRSRSSGPSKSMALRGVAEAGLDYLKAEHELQYRQMVFDLLMKQYE